jgi:DNA-binding response OmpR family regulator
MDKTILIIDDDVDFQFMVGSVLRAIGYEVKTLLEGRPDSAVHLASTCDIVLLDIGLPGVNGIDVGIKLRSTPETADIPIILISANSDVDEMFSRSEANAFMQKPFSLSTLTSKITELLKKVSHVHSTT